MVSVMSFGWFRLRAKLVHDYELNLAPTSLIFMTVDPTMCVLSVSSMRVLSFN